MKPLPGIAPIKAIMHDVFLKGAMNDHGLNYAQAASFADHLVSVAQFGTNERSVTFKMPSAAEFSQALKTARND